MIHCTIVLLGHPAQRSYDSLTNVVPGLPTASVLADPPEHNQQPEAGFLPNTGTAVEATLYVPSMATGVTEEFGQLLQKGNKKNAKKPSRRGALRRGPNSH